MSVFLESRFKELVIKTKPEMIITLNQNINKRYNKKIKKSPNGYQSQTELFNDLIYQHSIFQSFIGLNLLINRIKFNWSFLFIDFGKFMYFPKLLI